MLGVGLRKLCPQDSFGKAFQEKETVRKSTPEGAKPARGGAIRPFRKASGRLCCASCAHLVRPARSEAVFGRPWGRLWRSWSRLGGLLGRAGPLLGASWGPFWEPPRADLDDLGVVCGAT